MNTNVKASPCRPRSRRKGKHMNRTDRGFAIHSFTDLYGVECRLQKSSLATDDAIWLGAKEIGLKKFVPYAGGWQDVPLEMEPLGVMHSANTAMHLNREQVAALLPILHRFVDTGEIELLSADQSSRSQGR